MNLRKKKGFHRDESLFEVVREGNSSHFTDMLINTILLTLAVCGNCLYEDQIGKFDW